MAAGKLLQVNATPLATVTCDNGDGTWERSYRRKIHLSTEYEVVATIETLQAILQRRQ